MATAGNSGIYEIVNLVNGKRYIGSAVSLTTRFSVHRHMLRRGIHHSRFLQNSWNKYSEESFSFRRLLICAADHLVFYEQIVIDAFKPEYNVCRVAGSSLGVKWTKEARARHSLIQKANPTFKGRKHSPETLARMSASQMGVPSPMKGKPRSPEAVAKTAAAHLGRKRSELTRARIAAKAIGRKRTAESIEKSAQKLRGVRLPPERVAHLIGNTHAVGLKHTEEWKRANSERFKGFKRPKSPEYRAKIAATLRGRKLSPEHIANVVSGMKRAREARRAALLAGSSNHEPRLFDSNSEGS